MTQIDRKKLVKGTKLAAEPIDEAFGSVQSDVNASGFSSENLDGYESSFRMNFWLSNINYVRDVDAGSAFANKEQAYVFPFMLAPPQDEFALEQDETNKNFYTLRELTFSIDQGDEPIDWVMEAENGFTEFQATTKGEAGKWSVDVSIWSKTPQSSTTITPKPTFWENQIVKFNIPGTAFIADNMSLNPFIIENINETMPPDQSYCLTLEFKAENPAAIDGSHPYRKINNIQMSCRFTTALRQQNTDNNVTPTSTQNAPLLYRTATNDNMALTAINPTDTINEDPLQSNLEEIDKRFHHKLQSGHNTVWSKPFARSQGNVAAYDIFTVNLFNNNWNYRGGGLDVSNIPYSVGAGQSIAEKTQLDNYTQVADRRVIPIYHPFSIESIYLCWQSGNVRKSLSDHKSPESSITVDGSWNVDVILHSGWRSSHYSSQSIASLTGFNPTTTNVVDKAIDPFVQSYTENVWTSTGLGTETIFINQIPLNFVAAGTTEGVGYFDQGIPLYVGRGLGYNSDQRQQIANVGGTGIKDAETKGLEKLLEVVVKVDGLTIPGKDPQHNDDDHMTQNLWNASGLHLVFVCKKNVVKSEW